MDASNIFKPALSRGEMQCIGATTLNEYRKYIEKDSALDRRFQSVKVEPPSVEDTITILKGIRGKYEDHHKATYTDKALEAAVKLSDRYITGRFLPDKAIDVMDESGARARITTLNRPPNLDALGKEIDEVCAKKEKAISEQHFEEAAKFRDQEKQLRLQLEQATEEWKKVREEKRTNIDEDLIMQIVADWTGIPLSRMERRKRKTAHSRNRAAKSRRRPAGGGLGHRPGAAPFACRPQGSAPPDRLVHVCRPTGVGKTETAKQLAAQMFGNQDALIQIDMSEYMEKFAVSRLVGSPPGYVGYEEGGQLTEQVRRRPYAVILFDEVEKAHEDVIQILLQILEDGRLTDSLGRTVDFRNTIIIMTSNVGAQILQRQTTMGFSAAGSNFSDHEKMREKVLEEAKKIFKPEFLNRISESCSSGRSTRKISSRSSSSRSRSSPKRLTERKITLEFTDEAKALLVEKGHDEKYGARPLRRAVEHYLEDPFAEALLRGDIKEGEPVAVSREGEQLVFKQKMPAADTGVAS